MANPTDSGEGINRTAKPPTALTGEATFPLAGPLLTGMPTCAQANLGHAPVCLLITGWLPGNR